MLMMRELVPYLRWGKRGTIARTPSSETRFETPLEPMIAVLTAAGEDEEPDYHDKCAEDQRRMRGPHMYMARPEMRLSL